MTLSSCDLVHKRHILWVNKLTAKSPQGNHPGTAGQDMFQLDPQCTQLPHLQSEVTTTKQNAMLQQYFVLTKKIKDKR